MKNFWKRYSRKKRWWTIVLDFLFMAFVIVMLFPGTRKPVSVFLIRQTLFSPSETDKVVFLSENDWQLSLTRTGEQKELSLENFKGKPLFVNFWATWCPPCVAEMPSIQRLYDEYKDKVAFILISNENAAVINRFIEKNEYSMPVYSLLSNVPAVFETSTIPSTYLVSPSGRLLISKTGAAKWDSPKIKKILNQLLQ
ncbi:TlpA disulfide reductase family protein [Anaerophaga thermohalophila]|uniref:TlpA disulfide reductase family protein n=1 Tax=Anaerophaga thermohalophila TaxID=177400 RepID=UPI000237B8CC|nr:TlpA disulfide reductase family protein [Anaerophaga thermohalophila]